MNNEYLTVTITQDELNTIRVALLESVHQDYRILKTKTDEGARAFIQERIDDANALRLKLPPYNNPIAY